jgi:hypothetical protein
MPHHPHPRIGIASDILLAAARGESTRPPDATPVPHRMSTGIPIVLGGDKMQRAVPVAILYKSGKVYHLAGADWLGDFENELLHLPVGAHDDQVDGLAYGGLRAKYRPRHRSSPYGSGSTPPRGAQPCGYPSAEGLGFGGPDNQHPACEKHLDSRTGTKYS